MISRRRSDDDLFMKRIQSDSPLLGCFGLRAERSQNSQNGSNIFPGIVEVPDVNTVHSVGDYHAVIDLELVAGRSVENGSRFCISTRRAIKNQHPSRSAFARYQQEITDWINTHGGPPRKSRVRPGENADGRNVTVRLAWKYQNLIEAGGDVDFIVNGIDAHLIEASLTDDLGPRTLDDAQRRILSLSPALECEDRLGERTAHYKFIVDRIVREIVHRPAEPRFVTFQFPERNRVFLRQPGESRNLRMVHSVGHQDFFAIAVISNGRGSPES